MILVRLIVSKCLQWNLRVFAKWVDTHSNFYADALSRYKMKEFWEKIEEEGKDMNRLPDVMPQEVFPVEKIWFDN